MSLLRFTLLFPLLALLFSCGTEAELNESFVPTVAPAKPTQAALTKTDVLNLLSDAIANNEVLVGQHCGDGPDQTADFYDRFVEDLATQTGRYPALAGADLGYNPSVDYPVGTLIDHWNNGGLVTVSWHADNPFRRGYNSRWNSVRKRDRIDFRRLLKNASRNKAKTRYRGELHNIATALQELRDAGVVVIWRPFHEMNADFFWWGINEYGNYQTNEADYVALWVDMYETFTNDYGLDNLIWTYSPWSDEGWNAGVTAYYPGDAYVDLVGLDYYGPTPAFPHYDELAALGKTMVMTEAGPTGDSYGSWDEQALVELLRGKAAYFLQWHSWPGAEVAIIDNQQVGPMMNSAAAITRDEL